MATRLKNLRIKRVALVDEGANPDAFVRFAKNKDGEAAAAAPDEMSADEAQSLMKRFFSAIAKVFGGDDVAKKDAQTFGEFQARRDYNIIMEREVWPMIYAMSDSARSILFDDDKSDDQKETLLKQSASEFADAFTAAASNWAKAKEAGNVAKNAECLIRMRDDLNTVIAKAIDAAETVPPNDTGVEPDGQPTPNGKPDGKDDDVQKGATNMIFDTEKMTPEEKALYEDLAKRYGSEDPAPATDPAGNEPAPAPAADPVEEPSGDDMYKGLHPAVKQELEALRKFREESELREYAAIAKKYELLGKKPEELAPVLKSLKDAGGNAYDSMIALLDSNLAAVESSGAFSEIGKRGGDNTDDAWGKIEAAAQEIIKSKPTMKWAEAVDAACMQHPELVEAYEKSRR